MAQCPKMEPCIPLPLNEKTLNDLVEKAKDYCLMHGKKEEKLHC